MKKKPTHALSVRQPWAWAIIHGGKNIENRTAAAVKHGLGQPRRICIHASQAMTRAEYEAARQFMANIGVECPRPDALVFGQIIGAVTITGVTHDIENIWFTGPCGLILDAPEALIIPKLVTGQLGIWEWKAIAQDPPGPKKWMRDWQPEQSEGLL